VFAEQHERLAVGVAAWASVALENAHLYEEARTANRHLPAQRIERRRCESGFEMHLAKPVDPGELVASVATLARRGRLNTEWA
jgi:GAF domain-containing protein